MLPPTARFPSIERIIDQLGYFVVHGPRQIGKTTTILALARELTQLYQQHTEATGQSVMENPQAALSSITHNLTKH